MAQETTQDTRPVRETVTSIIPLYAKAVREQNLQDLILARHEMTVIVEQLDRAIAECLIKHIERQVAKG